MPIVITLDVQLAKRKMGVAELADAIGITPANVSVLKSGRAKAVRFSTLDAICQVLGCQPGDILAYEPLPPVNPVPGPGEDPDRPGAPHA